MMSLLHAGVSSKDPHIVRGFRYLNVQKTQQTYDLGLMLMAIEAKYMPLEMIRDVNEYSEKRARKEIANKISKEDVASDLFELDLSTYFEEEVEYPDVPDFAAELEKVKKEKEEKAKEKMKEAQGGGEGG